VAAAPLACADAGGGSIACTVSAAAGAPPGAAAVLAAEAAAAAWLAAVSLAHIVCAILSDCTEIPLGAKGMPSSLHKTFRAAVGSCRVASSE
jgi:hypothetical protein